MGLFPIFIFHIRLHRLLTVPITTILLHHRPIKINTFLPHQLINPLDLIVKLDKIPPVLLLVFQYASENIVQVVGVVATCDFTDVLRIDTVIVVTFLGDQLENGFALIM